MAEDKIYGKITNPETKRTLINCQRNGWINVLNYVNFSEVSPETLKGEKSLTIMFIMAVNYFYKQNENPEFVDLNMENWLKGTATLENAGVTSTLKCRTFLKKFRDNFQKYATCQYFEGLCSFNPDSGRRNAYMDDKNNYIVFSLDKYIDTAMEGNSLKPPRSLQDNAVDVSNTLNALEDMIDKGDLYKKYDSENAEIENFKK